MAHGVFPSVADQFREAYKQYLTLALKQGANTPRKLIEQFEGRIPAAEYNQICHEVEKELNLPTVHPKKGN
jgi:hypothetical protein